MVSYSRILSASALALVLLTQGAFADNAIITQVGQADDTAYIVQTGDPAGYGINNATIIQDVNSSNEFASITQGGVPDDFAEEAKIYQNGTNDSAVITQTGYSDYAEINQGKDGYANVAEIVQDSGARQEYALITQSGSTNYGKIYQNGSLDQASITQTGNDNLATINQGLNGVSSMNIAAIDQNGVGNMASIDQLGTASTATVTQVGTNHIASVIQH
jgi:hypothetical protein